MHIPGLSSVLSRLKNAPASGRLSRFGFGMLITFVMASTAYHFRPTESAAQNPPSVPVTDSAVSITPTSFPEPAATIPPLTPITTSAPAPPSGLVGTPSPTSLDPPPPPMPPRIVKNDAYYKQRQQQRAAALNRYDRLFRILNGETP